MLWRVALNAESTELKRHTQMQAALRSKARARTRKRRANSKSMNMTRHKVQYRNQSTATSIYSLVKSLKLHLIRAQLSIAVMLNRIEIHFEHENALKVKWHDWFMLCIIQNQSTHLKTCARTFSPFACLTSSSQSRTDQALKLSRIGMATQCITNKLVFQFSVYVFVLQNDLQIPR